ncbi:MAG: ATP-binding protein [Saprospiraceae bacterium]
MIDSIPQRGILLNSGWAYRDGDDEAWSYTDESDNGWTSIDPTKEIYDLPELFNSKVRWLKLDFQINKKLPKALGLAVSQASASQIYLNGKMIHEFGRFSTDPSKVIAWDPLQSLIYLPADSIGRYRLSVRYILQPNIRYTEIFGLTKNRLFKATLYDLIPAQHAQMNFKVYYTGIDIFILGLMFILFFLHLAFYIFQKKNKLFLLLTAYLFFSTLLRIFKIWGQNQNLVADRYYTLNIANWLLSFIVIFVATIFYNIAKERFDKFYFGIVIFFSIYAVVSSVTYGFHLQNILLFMGTLLNFVNLVRLSRKGFRKGMKGFVTLSIVLFFSILGLFCITISMRYLNYGISVIGYNELKFGINPYIVDLIFNFGSISVPIGLSLFMAIQGNETNKALSKQLAENELLKNKALEQEKEKQLILANQNVTLERQVTERTAELHQSLKTLKSTQGQLIQSEKLASLGELTAGVAHEIQNPLNFVKNFSELSIGITQDLNEELNKPEVDKPYIDELLKDLTQNQEKINHHGNRIASIVTGMLHHARTSTGKKEPTDLNALADEFLRLSYHGLRAKDSKFHAKMHTNFDPSIGKVEVVSQDLGRVFLNLINNAFYAVHQRSIDEAKNSHVTESYVPTVTMSTMKNENIIVLRIEDNGTGIPDAIQAKIFQPFYTTKPAGEGTGLGLSLSYDIITTGHGGTMELESKEGIGTVFIIKIPIS